jgi:hypothetical protein
MSEIGSLEDARLEENATIDGWCPAAQITERSYVCTRSDIANGESYDEDKSREERRTLVPCT